MSWIVQNLLRNKTKIKSEFDISSDEYNDLLVVEAKIKSLHVSGIISDDELRILSSVENGETFSDIQKSTGMGRSTFSEKLISLSDKIGFYCGPYFTDEGYLFYMKRKYKLTEEQVGVLREYINSKQKNKLSRRIYNG